MVRRLVRELSAVPEALLTAAEAAQALKVSRATVYALVAKACSRPSTS